MQTARDLGQGIPNAVPGAAGGLFIAGTNAATTITTSLTTTFTGNLTGTTGAVASVTGNVGGNVVGTVGAAASVTGSVGSIAAGGITNASFAADAISASKVNADVGTEYATAFWGTAIPGAFGAGTAGSRLGKLPDVTAGAAGGVFLSGSNAATTVNFTGNLSGSVGSVTGAVASVTGAVGSVASGGITAASFAADAITAAKVAADVGTEIAAAVAAYAGADPSAVPAANATLIAKLDWLCAWFRNKQTVNRTTGVVALRNNADSGNIGSYTASDDGTTFTRPEVT